MREVMSQLQIPEGMGAIVRTAGVGRSVQELQWDLDNSSPVGADRSGRQGSPAPSWCSARAMRDALHARLPLRRCREVLVDSQAAFQKCQEYMQRFMPAEAQRRLKLYTDDIRCLRASR